MHLRYLILLLLLVFSTPSLAEENPTMTSAVTREERLERIKKLKAAQRAEIPKRIARLLPEAEQGKAYAQADIGYHYSVDSDVHDDALAFKWMLKAARQGLIRRELGLLFYQGRGVEQNFEEAYYWILRSLFIHSDMAQFPVPDELKTKLSPSQRRVVRSRVAADIDQTDSWYLHLLGTDALFIKDFEDAYFWLSVSEKQKAKKGATENPLLRQAADNIPPDKRIILDTQVESWPPESPMANIWPYLP